MTMKNSGNFFSMPLSLSLIRVVKLWIKFKKLKIQIEKIDDWAEPKIELLNFDINV